MKYGKKKEKRKKGKKEKGKRKNELFNVHVSQHMSSTTNVF